MSNRSASGTGAGQLEMVSEYDPQATIQAIKVAWAKPVEGMLETGRLLCELKHGEWGKLFAPGGALADQFNQDTAEKWMGIARDPRLTDSAHVRNLPRAFTTMYELTRLTNEQWSRAPPAVCAPRRAAPDCPHATQVGGLRRAVTNQGVW